MLEPPMVRILPSARWAATFATVSLVLVTSLSLSLPLTSASASHAVAGRLAPPSALPAGYGWGAPAVHFTVYAVPTPAAGHATLATDGTSANDWSWGSGITGNIVAGPGPGSMLLHCAKMTRMSTLGAAAGTGH